MANQDKLDTTAEDTATELTAHREGACCKSESLPHPGFRTTEAVRAGRVYPALRCYRRPPQAWKQRYCAVQHPT